MTPATVHYSEVQHVQEQRQQAFDAAPVAHPGRFVGGRPTPPQLPKEVWINQPQQTHDQPNPSAEPAASEQQPGAQAASRAERAAALDASEHLVILEQPLVPVDVASIFLPKFEPELCQSP